MSKIDKNLTEMERPQFLLGFVGKGKFPFGPALLFALLTSHSLEPEQKHNCLPCPEKK